MHDSRAGARFPAPEVLTAAGWERSTRSLSTDPRSHRLTRTLWVRLPPAPADPCLRIWEQAALIQGHHPHRDLLISHLSAAQLWGLPIAGTPQAWTHQLLGESARHRKPEERPELSYLAPVRHQGNTRFLLHRGLGLPPAMGPWGCRAGHAVETLLQCLPWLPGWRAVAAADHLLATGPALSGPARTTTAAHLLAAAERLPPGTRGIRQLHAAVERSAPQTWSPMETLLRLALTRAGLPMPTMNLPVLAPSGRRMHLDLAWDQAKVAAEYNGRVHYENRQVYGDEQHRLQCLEEMGWRVRVVVVDDLRDPQRFRILVTWLRRALS